RLDREGFPAHADGPALEIHPGRQDPDRPAVPVGGEDQALPGVWAAVRKRELPLRDLTQRAVVKPLDQGVELAVFLQDIERTEVPAVLPDQAEERLGGWG